MRLAIAQWRPVTGGKAEGLARLDTAAAAAAGEGAEILVTPEMALTGYNIGAAAVMAAAEPIDGPLASAISEIARRHTIALLAGLPEVDGDIIYNAALMVDEDGERLATCRKSHLFGTVDRAQFAAAGDFAPVFTYRGWRLGLAICYDIEFPELVRTLALDGAEALLVPTANMEPYTGVPRRIVPARAEENEIFVAYANYVGTEGAFHYCGLSCIVGPDGSDLARAGVHDETIFADLDREHLQAVRRKLSHLNDRRPGLYGRLLRGDPK